MRENLPRILDVIEDGALVVSTYDDSIIYANAKARNLFPSAIENRPIDGVNHDVKKAGYIEPPERSGYAQLKRNDMLPLTVTHLPIYGGLWSVGSRLPTIEGFPPTLIFTFQLGLHSDAGRITAVGDHMATALNARIALELDEARKDVQNAMMLMAQAQTKIGELAEAMVSTAQSRVDIHSMGELLSLALE